jgi:hypothetical protein
MAGARSYGPETIYMSGDLEVGTYAIMAYIANPGTGIARFSSGCEQIIFYSG